MGSVKKTCYDQPKPAVGTVIRLCALLDDVLFKSSPERSQDQDTGMHLEGITAAQCCWDLGSGDELTSLIRSPPGILRYEQKVHCSRLESIKGIGCPRYTVCYG